MKGFLQLALCLFLFQSIQAQKDCRHAAYEEQIIAAHPALLNSIAGRSSLSNNASKKDADGNGVATVPEIIRIPVVVHIIYNKEAQNISDEQVLSQIEALNRDFRGINSDRKKAPAHFFKLAADCGIEFQLATTDPSGKQTTGIIRKWSPLEYFGLDDKVKNTGKGGANAWDPAHYLNVWVCNLAGGVLGYSSTPGGPADKDGIVISTGVFGTKGKIGGSFNLGRTATHEIGHWLNLRHIWGDTYCGDDGVDDTPKQRSANQGCPAGKKVTCGTETDGDMYMNFMDLTDDACMFMFTNGQKERMRALFQKGGLRNSLLGSPALNKIDSITTTPPPAENVPPVMAPLITPAVRLYPNPVTNFLSVSFDAEKNVDVKKEFIIYNHTGKPVMKETMIGSDKTFNISHLKTGLYYINIIEGDKTTTKKFMKL